jgi:hypothetical protein
MIKSPIYFFLTLAIFTGGCKKNNLPPTEENPSEPVFYVKGEINGVPVLVQAGVNNYFMYSSHFQQANNVYVYRADLKQSSCNGPCSYGIAILINDYKVSGVNAPMIPDSGLHAGHYQFNDGNLDPLAFMGGFTPTFNEAGTNYTWTYSDGMVQQGAQGGPRSFNIGQTYSVALTVSNGNCVQTHTNEFRIGSPLQANVSATCNLSTPATYSFTPYLAPNAGSGITYHWDFGDGASTPGVVTPTHAYLYGNKYYRSRLRLTNSAGDTCYSYYQVPVSVTTPTCHANFNSTFAPIPNTLGLSAITVLVTDPSGNVYSTETINQPTGNEIEIISVEEYKVNSQNEPTKKVKLHFNCTVKNGSGTLNITNGEAVIAVSYQ